MQAVQAVNTCFKRIRRLNIQKGMIRIMSVINVGLIGCGAFARGMHIPNLGKNPKFRIHAVMDIDEASAKEVAEETGASYWTTDTDKLLQDEGVDLVVITTRHDSHADLSIRAAKAGKHILCEKPMGMDAAECKSVAEAVRDSGVKYTVGYNRGLAPLVSKARELLSDMPDKKMIYHRLQAPFPEDLWIHDPKAGGGRFVGEGCHIFDLFCELVQAPPVMVYAAGGVFLNPEKVRMADSGIITISFADGSVASTLIASAGCAAFPKEATEVYCGGRAIYIADFKEMEYYGFEGHSQIRLTLDSVDKGQAREIDLLADAVINDTPSPNGIIKAARAAVLSYKVYESLAKGLPVPVAEKEYVFIREM